jgi:hypothetical protein
MAPVGESSSWRSTRATDWSGAATFSGVIRFTFNSGDLRVAYGYNRIPQEGCQDGKMYRQKVSFAGAGQGPSLSRSRGLHGGKLWSQFDRTLWTRIAWVSGLAITVATPAQARCLIGGQIRNDIPEGNDCLEAQRTGCVQRLLTPAQYTSCLQANKAANDSGKTCIIGGRIRNDLSAQDCQEGKATDCVRRLLTDAQYRACLDAQRH